MADGETAPGDRLRRLEAVTDAGLAQLDVDELLDELLERVRELLAVDTAAVLLLDSSARYLVATAARGIEEEVRQGVRIPLGKGFAGRIAAEKRPVFLERVDHTNVLNPILREKGIRSLLGVPLLVGGTVLGRPARRHADPPPVLGRRQRRCSSWWPTGSPWPCTPAPPRSSGPRPPRCNAACCPPALPEIPGLEFAARYVPGGHGQVGGDWYDVFTLAVRRAVRRGRRRRRPRVARRGRDGAAAAARCARTPSTPTTPPSCCTASTGRCATSSPTSWRPSCARSSTRPASSMRLSTRRAPATGDLRGRRPARRDPRPAGRSPDRGRPPAAAGTPARSRCRRAPPCACTPTAWSSAAAARSTSASTGSPRRCSPAPPSRSAPRSCRRWSAPTRRPTTSPCSCCAASRHRRATATRSSLELPAAPSVAQAAPDRDAPLARAHPRRPAGHRRPAGRGRRGVRQRHRARLRPRRRDRLRPPDATRPPTSSP